MMGPGRICILVLCIILYFQDALQAKAQRCRRTNKKPYRYCLDACTTDRDCRANEQCLCDGDCGLSCVRNGTKCGNLDTPKGLRIRLSDGMKFGSVARFSCRGDQYTLRGSKKRVCRGIRKWDGKSAKCRVLCKHPGDISYGNNNGDKKFFRVKATVRYWCYPRYTMEGNSVIECNNRGKWDAPPPKCAAPSCSKPTPPDNSYIVSRRKLKEKYNYNDVVRFRCEHGYYTSGAAFQRCFADGWSNSVFRCIPKSCGDPGTPVNGKRIGYVFTFKKKVYFKCNRGYKIKGAQYRQCQANQRWSDRTPTCEPITCDRLKDPKHGEKIEETSTNFEGKVVFRCTKKGFEIKGSVQRICDETGQWSGTETTCERVPCSKLQPIQNGTRTPDRNVYVFEDRVQFKCDVNYTMDGENVIICQDDRTWSKEVPRCLAPCRDPGIPIGGNRLRHSFLHNSIVHFRCKKGWSMEGSHTIRCVDGRWDHDTPTCSDCGSALGMENGKIPDGNIQATSSSTRWGYHAKDGRLNGRYAWCSSSTARDPYLQIDFGKPYRITGLATQGSAYDNKWVEEYNVKSNLAGSSFNVYREANRNKVFIGNRDKNSTVKHRFGKPFVARRLRIHPQKRGGFFFSNHACMRVEIYGCDLPSNCILVGSRVVAKWVNHQRGFPIYYKAYLTSILSRYWKVELENEKHGRSAQKYIPTYIDMPFVLDVPPKHEELQVGTRVLAPWDYTYFPCTIKANKDRYNRYHVRADDGDNGYFTIDKLRLLKAPTFCN